jgi:hypothetical protein
LILTRLGVGAIAFGSVAMVLTFVLKPAGMQTIPEDTGSSASGISVFGTIHPDIFRFQAPLGSGPRRDRVQLASLEPQFTSDTPADRLEMLRDTSDPGCRNASSLERFAAFDDRPASFAERTALPDGCPVSFDERFRSAMPVLASAVRPAPDRVQTRRAEAPPPSDDGRTAIYDIAAHTVYLPSGRRLEAHSGLGGIKDDPGHVQTKMRGATPPNVYNLALRERIFHGVRAIRLNPVDEGRMHGRDGILAHSYMLGPDGQSNGCVVFRNYSEFLDAFRNGEVARLAVVDRLESPPGRLSAGELPQPVKELMKATDRSRQYAAATPAGAAATPQDSP